ncbi:GNAT family N-acetyltransferase [Oscillospiraceae bacterium OttesenSCG-928-G22]|nr:GNAT family N-acetyltransferase [Oscillospiraceae bacterium OttesenSCG-928-G22]
MEFTLRTYRESDARAIQYYANNRDIAKYLRDVFPYPYALEHAEAYIASVLAEEGNGTSFVQAIDVGGEAVGSIGIFLKDDVYRRSAELGYWLGEPFWGKGIMTSAVRQICREGFLRFDIVRIFAEPYAQNAGSRRVLENAGFALEGVLKKSVYKFGTFFDSCVYALVKED